MELEEYTCFVLFSRTRAVISMRDSEECKKPLIADAYRGAAPKSANLRRDFRLDLYFGRVEAFFNLIF
jgi:hypothetical protein